MKKQISLALAGVMALSLAACGGSASTATSTSEAASTAESTEASSAASTEAAAAGDVLDQAAAAAFAQDVTLTMWGAEEDQDLLREISDKFIEKYGNYGGKITINRKPTDFDAIPEYLHSQHRFDRLTDELTERIISDAKARYDTLLKLSEIEIV